MSGVCIPSLPPSLLLLIQVLSDAPHKEARDRVHWTGTILAYSDDGWCQLPGDWCKRLVHLCVFNRSATTCVCPSYSCHFQVSHVTAWCIATVLPLHMHTRFPFPDRSPMFGISTVGKSGTSSLLQSPSDTARM